MIGKLRDYLRWSRWHLGRIPGIEQQLLRLEEQNDDLRFLIGSSTVSSIRRLPPNAPLRDAELKVFSQFGEDGILQHLVHHLGLNDGTFVEFGVENYRESNTRFLLQHDNWRGLVMDGDSKNIESIRNTHLMWRHALTAKQAFITRENINHLLKESGFTGSIELLSVDIDGNDYHVWEAIDVVDPVIVVCEYNSVFGLAPITTPYRPDFNRTRAHYSNLYFGASLGALCHLAGIRGYALIGCNRAGNNAFFIKRSRLGLMTECSCEEAYVCSKIRESKDSSGKLTHTGGAERGRLIAHLPVVDVTTGATLALGGVLSHN